MEHDKAIKVAEDLRRFADFIENSYHAIPAAGVGITAKTYLWDTSEAKDYFLTLVRAGNGSEHVDDVRKVYTDKYFELHLTVGDLDYEVWCSRDVVCERKVLGTETVIESVAIEFEDREIEKEIVEWECHPLLKSSA